MWRKNPWRWKAADGGEYNGEDNFLSEPSGGAIIPSELSSCPVGSDWAGGECESKKGIGVVRRGES